jgi:hypothetical protein
MHCLCPYLMSCYWLKLTSHIPSTVGLLTDGAQLITWTAEKSVHDPSAHRNQTSLITGNSISFTDVTPGLPRNSNNHIILHKISNPQSCITIDNQQSTYQTRARERMETHDVILSANPPHLHYIPPLCKQQQTTNANTDVEQQPKCK